MSDLILIKDDFLILIKLIQKDIIMMIGIKIDMPQNKSKSKLSWRTTATPFGSRSSFGTSGVGSGAQSKVLLVCPIVIEDTATYFLVHHSRVLEVLDKCLPTLDSRISQHANLNRKVNKYFLTFSLLKWGHFLLWNCS